MKKVLVLDCDNTLWGGVVGEDGVNGIQVGNDGIGRAYAMFQQSLLALESRGTLLALCSRNNPPDIEEVFARRVEMPLSRDRIVAAHIGWDPKPQGLRSLAETLSLGLDSFVFVDDSPTEREEVRHVLPDVTVPEFPGESRRPRPASGMSSAGVTSIVCRSPRGRPADGTVRGSKDHSCRESRLRGRRCLSPIAEHDRAPGAKFASAGQPERAALAEDEPVRNLTLRRYTEADVERMSADPGCLVISGQLADRFTDHGWVALAILKLQREPTSWLMEYAAVQLPSTWGGNSNRSSRPAASIVPIHRGGAGPSAYVPGPKNIQTREFYDRLGFVLLSIDESGARRYELPADRSVAREVDCIALNWAED